MELTCTDPDATLSVHNSVAAAKEGTVVVGSVEVKSAATVYLPKYESCGSYQLTAGQGYISSKQAKEKGWNVALVPCSVLRLKGLVEQCEQWMRTHLLYRPVRYDLPGPGPMELKVDLPRVSKLESY